MVEVEGASEARPASVVAAAVGLVAGVATGVQVADVLVSEGVLAFARAEQGAALACKQASSETKRQVKKEGKVRIESAEERGARSARVTADLCRISLVFQAIAAWFLRVMRQVFRLTHSVGSPSQPGGPVASRSE